MRGEGGLRGLSHEFSCAYGAQINFGELTLYVTYAEKIQIWASSLFSLFRVGTARQCSYSLESNLGFFPGTD
jgi:hypothetical protein